MDRLSSNLLNILTLKVIFKHLREVNDHITVSEMSDVTVQVHRL